MKNHKIYDLRRIQGFHFYEEKTVPKNKLKSEIDGEKKKDLNVNRERLSLYL